MASKRLETAKKYISHFATLDTQLLDSVLAEDHEHHFAPASLGMKVMSRQEFLAHNQRLRAVLAGFPVEGREYLDSESSNAVTVWATSQTQFHEGARDDGSPPEEWDYRGEYVFILTMDEAGEKIRRTVEFLDSRSTVDKLMNLMARARENLAKKAVQ
ncbi:hypothetical protein BX600DRAFT_432685 [Xylariales sp. PMI_506]|nr:hypothetical protein BX600DRAFT_432685 [Xylariales sp. PMI_506]